MCVPCPERDVSLSLSLSLLWMSVPYVAAVSPGERSNHLVGHTRRGWHPCDCQAMALVLQTRAKPWPQELLLVACFIYIYIIGLKKNAPPPPSPPPPPPPSLPPSAAVVLARALPACLLATSDTCPVTPHPPGRVQACHPRHLVLLLLLLLARRRVVVLCLSEVGRAIQDRVVHVAGLRLRCCERSGCSSACRHVAGHRIGDCLAWPTGCVPRGRLLVMRPEYTGRRDRSRPPLLLVPVRPDSPRFQMPLLEPAPPGLVVLTHTDAGEALSACR